MDEVAVFLEETAVPRDEAVVLLEQKAGRRRENELSGGKEVRERTTAAGCKATDTVRQTKAAGCKATDAVRQTKAAGCKATDAVRPSNALGCATNKVLCADHTVLSHASKVVYRKTAAVGCHEIVIARAKMSSFSTKRSFSRRMRSFYEGPALSFRRKRPSARRPRRFE